MTETLTRAFRHGRLEAESFPVAEVSDHLVDPDSIVWVDLVRPTSEELDELASELGLHELAVEDAIGPRQRPKLDRYPTHLFLTTYYVELDVEEAGLKETEVNAFFSDRWLITVRKDDGLPVQSVVSRSENSPGLLKHGVGFLLYALLDVSVDDYFDVLSDFDEFYEGVSDAIFAERPLDPARQRHWFEMRQATVRFHRLVVPMREAISALMRHEQRIVPEGLYPYFQDVYDHMLRVSESSDSLRDLVTAIVETNFSLRDYRQNQVVKKVSSWAAIVAVPALITGYYGMNVPYPGSGAISGVLWSTGLIIGVSATLYFIFRRNDWL